MRYLECATADGVPDFYVDTIARLVDSVFIPNEVDLEDAIDARRRGFVFGGIGSVDIGDQMAMIGIDTDKC